MENVRELSAFRPQQSAACTQELSAGPARVIYLLESRAYALRRLRFDMENEGIPRQHRQRGLLKPFTQRFCRIARRFSGLSEEELCERLNEQPRILKLRELPGLRVRYPFRREFIFDMENNLARVAEYNPYTFGGFSGWGSFGVPTQEVARAIAEVCGSRREFRQFEDWCREYVEGGR